MSKHWKLVFKQLYSKLSSDLNFNYIIMFTPVYQMVQLWLLLVLWQINFTLNYSFILGDKDTALETE